MKKYAGGLIILVLIQGLVACTKPEPNHAWLSGDEYQRIDTVAEHLRGNDLVMWEVQYRHNQLYEAIVSNNSELAFYQLKKIKVAMSKGMERRPKRKESYEWFFQTAIPAMENSLNNTDGLNGYKVLTNHCIQCHAMENVEFMPVDTPWKE
jgi:cytochrome c1